jgi:hypothetical protein
MEHVQAFHVDLCGLRGSLERVVKYVRFSFASVRSSPPSSPHAKSALVGLIADISPTRSGLKGLLLVPFAVAALATAENQARATWKPEYANAAPEIKAWYQNAQLTQAAQKRFGFKSCCAHSDVVRTEFRVDKATNGDEWYWLNNGRWTQIPSDIIHWGESAPDRQPTLFAIGNLPTCFYPGQGGL